MLDVAILGLGRGGSVLVDAVQGRSESIRFIRAVVRTPAKYAALSARHGLDTGTDYAAVLADPKVKAIVLATPHSQHVEQVIRAAQAGKHVLCDKPFATDLAGAERAQAAADAAGVVLAIGFQRRFLPAYAELKRRIDSGALGDPVHVEANQSAPAGLRLGHDNWRSQPGEMRGGAMGGHGIHMVDMMIGLFGPIVRVNAWARKHYSGSVFDDTTLAMLDFANGRTGTLTSVLVTAPLHRITVMGTKGWAQIADHRFFEFRPLAGAVERIEFPEANIERIELEAFADAVAGKAPFAITRAEALHGQAVFDAVAMATEQGGTVTVPATT